MADNKLIRSVNKAEEPGHEVLEPASKRWFNINTLRTKNEITHTKETSLNDQKRKYTCSKLIIDFEIESGQIQ